MRRFKATIALLALILQIGLCTDMQPNPLKESEAHRMPNVILITTSSLRADHVGCMGYQRDATPNFDSFAKRNCLFEYAFAVSSWMMPAHGSIFTSLYPSFHGATHIDEKLAREPETLAEVLSHHGYYCVGFCFGPRLSSEYGFAQGFDLYDDYSASMMLAALDIVAKNDQVDINKERSNNTANAAAIRWLNNNTHTPFFLFVHYYDNHWDYLPPSPYNTLFDPDYTGQIDGHQIAREPLYSNPPEERDIQHMIALYDGEIRQTDADLGELIRFIEKKGLLDNSIVVVMGDHGEQFYEHGHTSHHGLWDELIHIPMIVSLPENQNQARVIDGLVSQVDIMPTLLDRLGIPLPEACQGKSFLPLLRGQANSMREFVFAEYTGGAVGDCYAVRSRTHKYLFQGEQAYLFDFETDPREQMQVPLMKPSQQAEPYIQFYSKWRNTQSRPEDVLLNSP